MIWEYIYLIGRIQYIDSVMETIEMMNILNLLKPQVVLRKELDILVILL